MARDIFVMYDENKGIIHTLPIIAGPLDDFEELLEKVWDEFVRPLEEEHGIHDISFCTETELFGFSSYEIEDWATVLSAWKDKIKELGFVVEEWHESKDENFVCDDEED